MLKSLKKKLTRNDSQKKTPITQTINNRRIPIAELSQKIESLKEFDEAINAADALACEQGAKDCSVLVSADGNLLFLPESQNSNRGPSPLFSQLVQQDQQEYDSAVVIGSDMINSDATRNGFSAKGWSIPATTYAMVQTQETLDDCLDFLTHLVQEQEHLRFQRERALEEWQACEATRSHELPISKDWEFIDPNATNFSSELPTRVGPFMCQKSSLLQATKYYQHYMRTSMAEERSDDVLKYTQKEAKALADRAYNRQLALDETMRRARRMEDHLEYLKKDATRRWRAVAAAEERVTKRLGEIMQRRSQLRERERLDQMRSEDNSNGKSSEDIWNIVNSVTDSLENDGSFETMDLPATPRSIRKAMSIEREVSASSSNIQSIDIQSQRELVEQDMRLPELRAAAVAADEAVTDASGSLLNIISNLDTARRSARIAAETALVAAGNAQASALRWLVSNERKSLEERLKRLEEAEKAIEDINVRKDLEAYITMDMQEPGGRSHLGDDEDGGIASALAVLSAHLDGHFMEDFNESRQRTMSEMSSTDSLTNEGYAMERIDESIEKLFEGNESLHVDGKEDQASQKSLESLEKAVDFLCKAAADTKARSRRSTVCYKLNAKRGSNAEIPSEAQFTGLCKLFSSILNACSVDDHGVANAKMSIMLAQSFYYEERSDAANAPNETPSTKRRNRVYVKSKLVNLELWKNDEFWDEALSQQLNESLTHSGLASNFERTRRARGPNKSEWQQDSRMRWHDLSLTERIEAAMQVQAVVFAQLSALAHSMVELGCGLDRSVAFVRRNAVRNQLPLKQRAMLLKHIVDRDDKQDDAVPTHGFSE